MLIYLQCPLYLHVWSSNASSYLESITEKCVCDEARACGGSRSQKRGTYKSCPESGIDDAGIPFVCERGNMRKIIWSIIDIEKCFEIWWWPVIQWEIKIMWNNDNSGGCGERNRYCAPRRWMVYIVHVDDSIITLFLWWWLEVLGDNHLWKPSSASILAWRCAASVYLLASEGTKI